MSPWRAGAALIGLILVLAVAGNIAEGLASIAKAAAEREARR